MLLHAVLAFALFETLALAGVLLIWADRVVGARLLAAFLLGIALWIAGNEVPNWFGPGAERPMMMLLATAPLSAAFFFHFCVVFCRVEIGRIGRLLAYGLGGGAMLSALWVHPGTIVAHPDIGWLAQPSATGWIASGSWAVLGLAGVAVLLRSLLRTERPAFSQIAAVTVSCLWGMLCLSGYLIAVRGWPIYPFPLLGLPFYPLILVYGILRYGVFVANAWARRALVWALLLALGAAIIALTPLLPFESRWIGGLAVAASCLALNGPVRRLAERLVYRGGEVSAADLAQWRGAFASVETTPALAAQASQLLSARIGTEVAVQVGESPVPNAPDAPPTLRCLRDDDGVWQVQLQGWEAAPPGLRRVAEMFGTVVTESAARVELAQQIAARDRERQLQARLAELGALATTVAHDIRNPLNIIAMATAAAPPETRREVNAQVARISHLTRDLLDFAKPWKLAPAHIDLAALVRSSALRLPQLNLGDLLDHPLLIDADARRIEQALVNLLENARGAAPADDAGAAGAPARRIHIDAERTSDAVLLHVCDDGPGVPEEIRDRLFEPFASRSPGGTGLGLAIVARIMQAHGGSVALTARPPWRTCFTLRFPSSP